MQAAAVSEVFPWLVGICAAYVVWVIAGYPLWLHRAARAHPRPVAKARHEPYVTAVIPVHNGANYLPAKLDSLLASAYPAEKLDILVLADGCTDETEEVARGYAETNRVHLLSLPRGGKAAALNAAFPRLDREVLLLTDVRQRLDRECVSRLMQKLPDPAVGVVSGDLRILAGESSQEANVGLYWRYESWIRSHLGRYDSLLGATGPI